MVLEVGAYKVNHVGPAAVGLQRPCVVVTDPNLIAIVAYDLDSLWWDKDEPHGSDDNLDTHNKHEHQELVDASQVVGGVRLIGQQAVCRRLGSQNDH